MELTTSSTVVEHPTHNLNVKGSNQYLINFDFLPVRIDRQGLSLEARAGLDLAYDDGAHVGILVDDGHHEGAIIVKFFSEIKDAFLIIYTPLPAPSITDTPTSLR